MPEKSLRLTATIYCGRWHAKLLPLWFWDYLPKNQENIHNFFEKGIDFMRNLRYNWSVHEHNTEQEV